jgi:hypothetical protein
MIMDIVDVVVPVPSVSEKVIELVVPAAPITPLSSPLVGPGAAVRVQVVVAPGAEHPDSTKPDPGEEVEIVGRVTPELESVTVRTDV